MAKISTYAVVVPTTTDKVIGTDTDNSGVTKNFTIQSIADFAALSGYVYPRFNVVATSAAALSPSIGDFVLIDVDNHISTLPTAVGQSGKVIGLYQVGSPAGVTNIQITTSLAQTINGQAPPIYLAARYDKYMLMSDGANWVIIGD